MKQLAKIVFKSYKPKHLEKDMLFLTNVGKGLSIVQIDRVPQDEDEYVRENGYPVEPYIVDEGNPNLNDGYVIALPHIIAWLDEGDHTDELRDLTEKDYRRIMDDNGYIYIDAMENDDDLRIFPIIYEGKVVISFVNDVHEEDEEHSDWEEIDEKEYDDDEYEYMLEGDDEWEFDNTENNDHEKDEE